MAPRRSTRHIHLKRQTLRTLVSAQPSTMEREHLQLESNRSTPAVVFPPSLESVTVPSLSPSLPVILSKVEAHHSRYDRLSRRVRVRVRPCATDQTGQDRPSTGVSLCSSPCVPRGQTYHRSRADCQNTLSLCSRAGRSLSRHVAALWPQSDHRTELVQTTTGSIFQMRRGEHQR